MPLLSHAIPTTRWRASSTWAVRPPTLVPLVAGLSLFGFGEGLLVASKLGATPWTVLAEGVSRHLGTSLGWSTAGLSALVLLAWIPLRERPGFGTIANMVLLAYVLDLTAASVGTPHALVLRWVMVLGGVGAIGLGSSFYLTTGLGPGPRDGLMTSIHRRLGVSVVWVRLTIEVCVLGAGWLLGGTVGLGTAFFAATVGFFIGASLKMVSLSGIGQVAP